MKDKVAGGNCVAESTSRWSTRQASLYYKRQNHKSFPCRRIPSLFSGVKVLTDADLMKESRRGPENMVDKSSSPTKRLSASCEHKTKQGQVNKAKEISGRNTGLSSQVNVKKSKSDTSLKRKYSGEDSCDRPSKRKPAHMVKLVSKDVQKTADNKQTKWLCKNTRKTEVGKDGTCSLGSKNSVTKSAPSTNYKVLTRPCSVPVVPVGSPQRIDQERSGTVLLLKKVLPSTHVEVKTIPPRKSLVPLGENLSDENINKNVDHIVQDLMGEMAESGLEMQPKPGLEKNEDDSVLERTVSVKTETIPKCVTDFVENDLALDEKKGSDYMIPECELENQSKQDSSESEMVKCNRLLSDDVDCEETKESKTENVIIKRSARISRRRAKFNITDLLPWNEKSQGLNSGEEFNLVKVAQSDCHQSNLAFKASSHDDSNQTAKRDTPADANTTQHQSASSTNTKYTQRMSWQLHPQVIPVDKIDPVSVGDIVWGKVHGHPWWPGKVLAISAIRNEDSRNPWDRDAHVSWFGSNTSSIMRLHGLQLFLPNFSRRHKRRKKGFYRVAVRQAQEAAQAMVDKD